MESIHKRIIIVLTVVFLFVISNGWASDKIFLNSGEIVEGEIVHETPIFVRIRTIANKTEEYLQSRIDHLEFEPLDDDIEQKDSSLSESTNTPENTVDTIILKTGRIVKGKIIRQTPIFVRIQTDAALGIENFMIEHIERINTDDILEQKDPSMDISQEVIKTDANILTVPNTATETIPLENKIVPYSKVISRDSPEPSSSQDYRRINDPITSNSGQSYQNAAPNMKNFEEVQKEIAKLENASLSDQVSKGDMANIVTETPHIFNTEAYNDFLDQTITTSNYKRENTHQQQSALLKQAMEARANAASGGAQGSLDKAKEMIPEFLMAIVIGAGVPILIGIVFLIICIGKMTLNQGENKEVDDELKSLSSLKEENKISDEEYNNLTAEAKKHLSESPVKTFLQSVPRIFIYPVRGKVLLSTLGATVVFYIFRIAMYAPFYGFFAMIFAFCYFVACIVKIIETAVTEEREDIFDWPSFTDMVDWFGKAFLFLIGWLICHGTAILIFINLFRYEGIRLIVVSVSIASFIIGLFVYPMYILAMSLVGGAASLNIINTIKAIKTTYVSYILTLALLFFSQILSGIAHAIPIIGIPLFGGLLKWFIFVYFFLVNMRLLGIFYKTHRLQLRWYGEDE